jgi:hypothetical protein
MKKATYNINSESPCSWQAELWIYYLAHWGREQRKRWKERKESMNRV